jgi:AraC-like DNA-binding protein
MRVAGAAAWIRTVSTLDVPGTDRWRTGGRAASETTGCLKNHAYGDPTVDGLLEVVEVAWLQVIRITAGRHRVVHEPARAAVPSVAIALQVTGTSVVEQQGRTASLVAGHWSVCNSSEPYTILSPASSQRLVLLIPSNRIERGIDLNSMTARVFPGTTGVSRLAFGAAGWLLEEFASLSMVRADDLAESLCRLITLAIYERTRQLRSEPGQRTLANRIREYVAQHLHDPDLSLDTMARELNASKRSLHRAMSDIGDSIHNLIWHARLERCRDDLGDPAKSQQSIAYIAQSWGFKNSTHFSRAFRTRFGMSAREARRAACVERNTA